VCVCESHVHAGGAAHSFEREGFKVGRGKGESGGEGGRGGEGGGVADVVTNADMPTDAVLPMSCVQFDSGPSLFSGVSLERSPNPLAHVLQFIDETVEFIQYDTWGVVIPEGRSLPSLSLLPFLHHRLTTSAESATHSQGLSPQQSGLGRSKTSWRASAVRRPRRSGRA
jgi:hypothetical protein